MFRPKGLSGRWILLICGDFSASMLASYSACAVDGSLDLSVPSAYGCHTAAVILAALYLCAMYFQDLYTLDRPRNHTAVTSGILMASAKATVVLGLAVVLSGGSHLTLGFLGIYVPVVTGTLIVWRAVATHLISNQLAIAVMAMGVGEYAPLLADEIERHQHLGYRLLGFMSGTENPWRGSAVSERAFPFRMISGGPVDELSRQYAANVIVVMDPHVKVDELLRCRLNGIQVVDLESFVERLTGKLPITYMRPEWISLAPGFGGAAWKRGIKRLMDIAVAAAMTLLSLPLGLLTALAIKLDSTGPIFYSQERIGRNGRVFRIWKFRSMADRAAGPLQADKNDPRVTRVGRFIRQHRIDELPQLFNVIKGDMSLVGPRPQHPELVRELRQHLPLYDFRHTVRPGLTSWAHIYGGYAVSVDDHRERLSHDLYYIKNWTNSFDLQILLQTVKLVSFGRGSQ